MTRLTPASQWMKSTCPLPPGVKDRLKDKVKTARSGQQGLLQYAWMVGVFWLLEVPDDDLSDLLLELRSHVDKGGTLEEVEVKCREWRRRQLEIEHGAGAVEIADEADAEATDVEIKKKQTKKQKTKKKKK